MIKRLLFIGPPGSGKGTFAKRVAPALGLVHLSAGDLLRWNVREDTSIGREASSFLNRGELVPGELVVDMMRDRVQELRSDPEFRGYLLDGFPRVIEQARLWETRGDGNPELVVNICLNEEVLVTKLASRRVCECCGDNYNLADIRFGSYDMPPLLPKVPDVCDSCSGRLVQREDDNEETVRKRLQVHALNERDLIEFYKAHSHVIDFVVTTGVKQTPDLLSKLQKKSLEM